MEALEDFEEGSGLSLGTNTRRDGVSGRVRAIQLGPRDHVVLQGATPFAVVVKLSADDALGFVGAGAGDLNVDARRVVLLAVDGYDFVTEDVLSRRESLWDCRGPRVVGAYELHSRPFLGLLIKAELVNFNPLERFLIDIAAVTAAVGDVRQYRAHVRGVP